MKYEYKERVQEHLSAIASRIKVIKEMLSGERNADAREAAQLTAEIERLLELSNNIIDLS